MRVILAVIFSTIIAFSSTLLPTASAQQAEANNAQIVIADQLNAFLEGDDTRAFSHAAPSTRQLFGTSENFINMVRKGYLPLYRPSNFRFGKNLLKEGILYQELITTDEAGKKWRAIYSLQQQADGIWKIIAVKLDALDGSSI